MKTKEVVLGSLLLVISVATTCVYESALVGKIKQYEEARSVVMSLSEPHYSASTEGQLILFSGLITTTGAFIDKNQWNDQEKETDNVQVRQSPFVLDPVFGIATKGVRLDRQVEMLQWVETSHTSMSSTREDEDQRFSDERERIYMYDLRWKDKPIDSIGFNELGYTNPPPEAWKYMSAVIKANDLVVGDFKLADELVDQIQRRDVVHLDASNRRVMAHLLEQRIGTAWEQDSALTNISVQDDFFYFRDGEPVLGDQRVHFEVTPNYPVTVCGLQKGKDVVPLKSSTGEAIYLLEDGIMTANELFDKKTHTEVRKNWFFRLFAGVLGFMGFIVLRRPLIERFGSLLAGIQQHLLGSSMSIALTFTVVGANWILYRPLWALVLWLGGWTPLICLILVSRNQLQLKDE
ncbi:unnamed protein product [Peronospora belbahrii]|uniref:Transmembrane protein 43 n=1 Tax=Peronospora belbahrii TaxID=622444 RepID=A0AAU9L907_9STRA|nr:unnamed protein product [Peronospora belbahrii]CAH0518040.1 unnamed protein product [Peronospora belbahrii]